MVLMNGFILVLILHKLASANIHKFLEIIVHEQQKMFQ